MKSRIQSPEKLKLSMDGKSFEVLVQKIGQQIWYQTEKGTSTVELEVGFSSRKKRKSADANLFQILAPMPGKITKVLAAEGAEVTPGQSLIVMEAMKMEYTLKSPDDRKIKSVHVKVGDQVALGQVLVDFVEAQNG